MEISYICKVLMLSVACVYEIERQRDKWRKKRWLVFQGCVYKCINCHRTSSDACIYTSIFLICNHFTLNFWVLTDSSLFAGRFKNWVAWCLAISWVISLVDVMSIGGAHGGNFQAGFHLCMVLANFCINMSR